jgi:hypothetical protein
MSRKATATICTKMVLDHGRSHQFGAQCAMSITAISIKTTLYDVHRFGTHRALTVHLTRKLRALSYD